MTGGVCWRLADIVSRTLEPDEGAAVLGDLAEAGETGRQVLRAIAGLAARREVRLWKDWRLWLALGGLIVPLAVLLSVASRSTAYGSSIYIWLYANNFDWSFLGNAAYWHDLLRFAIQGILSWLMLACWSWTGGYVVGCLSPRSIRTKVLFIVALAILMLPDLLRPFDSHPYGPPVFALTFYRVEFPAAMQAALVILPALWGMRHGLRLAGLAPARRTILWAAIVIALSALVAQDRNGVWAWLGCPGCHYSPSPVEWESLGTRMQRLQPVTYWPVVYYLASAIRRRWHGLTMYANP